MKTKGPKKTHLRLVERDTRKYYTFITTSGVSLMMLGENEQDAADRLWKQLPKPAPILIHKGETFRPPEETRAAA